MASKLTLIAASFKSFACLGRRFSQAAMSSTLSIALFLTLVALLPFLLMGHATAASASDNQDPAFSTDGTDNTVQLFLPAIRRPAVLYFPSFSTAHWLQTPHPIDDAGDQSPSTYFSWDIDRSDSDEFRFDVYIDADNPQPNTLIAGNLESPYLDPETLAFGTTYYWQVTASNPSGDSTTGPVWSFTTMEPPPTPPDIDSMRLVPAGEFQMGCNSDTSTVWPCFILADSPLHNIYLDAYEISKYEVTNRQYRACVDAGECRRPRYGYADGRDHYFDNPEYDYYPVVYVAWEDAHAYCDWAGMRLPTEAEWEKAARGDGDTRFWPWGNEEPTCDVLANLDAKNCGRPQVTDLGGAYPGNVSPYGVFDMSGNVYEWVYDYYDDYYYRYSPYANPTGPEDSTWHSIRGGSYRGAWVYRLIVHRKSGHYGDIPLFRSSWVGFRCARSVDVEE